MNAGGINNPVLESCIFSIYNVYTCIIMFILTVILDTIDIHKKKQYTWVL